MLVLACGGHKTNSDRKSKKAPNRGSYMSRECYSTLGVNTGVVNATVHWGAIHEPWMLQYIGVQYMSCECYSGYSTLGVNTRVVNATVHWESIHEL